MQSPLHGHSTKVQISLLIDGERLNVAQIGGGLLILREPRTIPPSSNAEIVLKIDDREESQSVVLFEGTNGDSRHVRYR